MSVSHFINIKDCNHMMVEESLPIYMYNMWSFTMCNIQLSAVLCVYVPTPSIQMRVHVFMKYYVTFTIEYHSYLHFCLDILYILPSVLICLHDSAYKSMHIRDCMFLFV